MNNRVVVLAAMVILAMQPFVEMAFTVPLSHAEKYEGQVVGTGTYRGECAAGVQHVFYDYYGSWVLDLTSTWEKGNKVAGNYPYYQTPAGTAIACFRYSNSYSAGHAAIFVGYESDGIRVWDQWVGKAWSQRTIRYKPGSSFNVNNGNCYYEIEH